MRITKGGLLGDWSSFETRLLTNLNAAAGVSMALKALGMSVVLTSGSFDLLHEGHSRYLEKAAQRGDFLFVGVDSDDRVRQRKGPGRPAVPQEERMRMLTHQRGVGAVVLKETWHLPFELIDTVRPDILVVTEGMYSPVTIRDLQKICGGVAVFPRMAEVSTSGRLRAIQLGEGA